MLAGKVPPDTRPNVFGVCLTALAKKDGGIQPIAVGESCVGKVDGRRFMESIRQLVRLINWDTDHGEARKPRFMRHVVCFWIRSF
jgi:hypothetical protein